MDRPTSGSSIGVLPDPDAIVVFGPQDDHLGSVVEAIARGESSFFPFPVTPVEQ